MGLDTSYDCWHGSYGAFHVWRVAVANGKSWGDLKPSPLHILLDHSDCDGSIECKDCIPIAKALTKLLPKLRKAGEKPWILEATQNFIDGLEAAAEQGDDVDFH